MMSNYIVAIIFMVMVMMIKLVREENERGGRNENSQEVTVWCPRVPESRSFFSDCFSDLLHNHHLGHFVQNFEATSNLEVPN